MMPKKEGFHILDVQSAATREDKAKNTAGLHPQNVVRKKLADISNQPQNQRLLIQEKSQSIETTTKEYISQLQKENMALVKMLAQRNKIIEHNGNELDRLRVHLLKMQEQNQQLALSNNQMLVELNSVAKQGRARSTTLVDADAELIKSQEDMDSSKVKPHETTNLQPSGVSVCPTEQVESEEKTVNKRDRPTLRRQSARFKPAEVKPAEDLFETNKTRVCASQLPEDTVCEQSSVSESALVKNEGSTDGSGPGNETQQFGRLTVYRPSRAAAKKVQSYKEVSIKVKLRRPE